jgi:2-phosphosulfolactate phosphatase
MPALNVIVATGAASATHSQVAIVADILRASTTITRALELGAASVTPVLTPNQARTLATGGRRLLMGERRSVRIPGFDLGNSPAELTSDRVRGREIIFTSTNFPRTIAATARARQVFVGCFLNLSTVATTALAAAQRQNLDLCIALAGDLEHEAAEDLAFAGALALTLQARGCTLDASAQEVAARVQRTGAAAMVRGAIHTAALRQLGFEADIDIACRVDASTMVGVLRDGSIWPQEPASPLPSP